MTRRNRESGAIPLLAAILEGRPTLSGARCIDRHDLFDAARFPEPGTDPIPAQIAAERLCCLCTHSTRCPDSLAARPHQESA
ncbi:transcriptional regulator [Rhodococcus sp. Q]|uniref:transcriptional regulator n=1 Tax=Rhodococcus sp. Q TaxID=2502252 RepID=UPI0010F83EB7|nr:transcriptional regulator [Rhodococcus sp. Q]